jgi:hypothetical protein
MKILLTDSPSLNGYIESLINAYSRAGHSVTSGANDFFYSDCIPDILHIHWPESLYLWHAPEGVNKDVVCRMMAERLAWFKSHGVTIINTIHNLKPHDGTTDTLSNVYRMVIEHADILVHHCTESINLLTDSYPAAMGRVNIVCPHGDYLNHYKFVGRDQARSHYGISMNKLVILNFGRQRPYKNEHFITTVFNRLRLQSKYLVIAGIFAYPARRKWLRIRNRFRKFYPYRDRKYIYRSFPISEIPYIISIADIIFLGQRNGLNSGLTALAATYRKPVVCPDIGCFRQSLDSWHHETYAAGDVEDATRALQRMCNRLPGLGALDNSDWLRIHSWDVHVAGIIKALPDRKGSQIRKV